MTTDEVYIRHMLDAIDEIMTTLHGVSYIQLVNEPMRMHATVRLFEILGEAASKLTIDLRKQHADIPFGDIIGMRNKLIHHYFEVDLEILWRVYEDDLVELQESLKKLL